MGIICEVGSEVLKFVFGDRVVAPFTFSWQVDIHPIFDKSASYR